MKKIVYMIQIKWCMDSDSGVENYLYSTYEKALESFYNTIEDEKENTWVNDYCPDGEFDDDIENGFVNYHFNDDKEVFRKWFVQKRYDHSYRTEVILEIMAVND